MTSIDRRESEIIAALQRFGALLAAHDPAIVREFAADADVLFVGSEADELARGPGGITNFLRTLVDAPVTISFEWSETHASVIGDGAWLFASGEAIVLGEDDSERRVPYRLTGVFVRREGQWLWTHFHGSEPAASAATD